MWVSLRQILQWRILKNDLVEFLDYALDAICAKCNTSNAIFIMTCIVVDVGFQKYKGLNNGSTDTHKTREGEHDR